MSGIRVRAVVVGVACRTFGAILETVLSSDCSGLVQSSGWIFEMNRECSRRWEMLPPLSQAGASEPETRGVQTGFRVSVFVTNHYSLVVYNMRCCFIRLSGVFAIVC